ncbi:peptidase MA family protein [Treponema socranskii subsp. socranskii VPI DR56BR1116 = ATCC 35536]|uniref:Peptidase MA family protein n=1 Tax=Treponema socranskii subsp. socranskii VPI DR56BR1116 = ATCC 35536 TaxID=1125725 RepID=U2KYB0_TRESO|nr:peptidase MA [Treponema socranskii]ERF60123.1 peptidase MA family protein [Treponema socranskii subsp. socranskii VPI DR56BR1116 = ATCC 35536]ERK03437.1 peptidase MA family protein [Treponema socranskii subsp. socranskii VPI DR56BR1116 = ATCC 35536]
MKKIIINFFIVSIFVSLSLSAADGVMWGEKDIRVVKTQWFDIIYAPDSARSAEHLARHADAIYEDVCAYLETEQWKRFPVVIASAQDEFNAYYSPACYDTIVMYDTPVTKKIAVASDDFLSTFRHELTHAVSYNMKNAFWRGIGAVFGDVVNPAYLFITRSRTEGVAVASESAGGEGRLNDPYSAQTVRQAKIESAFPSHADIYGSRDIYPYDTNYHFGAAFENWIQKTYGMKNYARFLYKCVNFQTIHASAAFKSVYGISVKEAWKHFYDSIVVPASAAQYPDPLVKGGCKDYFSGTDKRSKENARASRYASLVSCSAGFGFTDDAAGSFYFSKWDAERRCYDRVKKICTVKNLRHTSLSTDGEYAAFSVMSERHAVPKSEVHIVNMKSRSRYTMSETGLRDAAVVLWNGAYYLAAIKTKSQQSTLTVYKLDKRADGKVRGASLIASRPLARGDVAFTPKDAGGGEIVYVCKSGMHRSIRLYSIADGTEKVYDAPYDRMVIGDVSLANSANAKKVFTFSWAAEDTMPRFGKLIINNSDDERRDSAVMLLQTDDVSGGVYNPVMLQNGSIAYTGHFFRDNRLLTAENDSMAMRKIELDAKRERVEKSDTDKARSAEAADNVQSEEQAAGNRDAQTIFARSKKYNPLDYYKRGIFLPVGIASTYGHNARGDVTSMLLPLGLTYASNNPWSSKIAIVSGGYSILSNSGAIETRFQSGTATSLFKYSLSDQIEFDRRGFKQTAHTVNLSSAIPVGRISRLTFGNDAHIFAGRQSRTEFPKGFTSLFGILEDDDALPMFIAINKLSVGYSNIYKTGAGVYERAGFAAGALYIAKYESEPGTPFSQDKVYQNISVNAALRLPRLLPYVCRYDYTYNFPFALGTQLFPNKSTFIKNTAEIILFAGEVQKAIPLFYVNRWALRASYTGRFDYTGGTSWDFFDTPHLVRNLFSGEMRYCDSAVLSASLTFTPNFGAAATPLLTSTLRAGLRYVIRETKKQNYFAFEFGWNLAY